MKRGSFAVSLALAAGAAMILLLAMLGSAPPIAQGQPPSACRLCRKTPTTAAPAAMCVSRARAVGVVFASQMIRRSSTRGPIRPDRCVSMPA
jgi:hypothetical protein